MVARFGVGGDVIGEVVGVFIVADDDGAESAVALAKAQAANEAEDDAIEQEEKKTEDESVDSDGAHRKEVARTKKVESDDSHDANHGGDEETPSFATARLASEDAFGVKPQRGKNDDPDGDEEGDF